MLDLWVKVARSAAQGAVRAGSDSTWAADTLPKVAAMADYVLALRRNATADQSIQNVTYGMVYGSAEHDLCIMQDYYLSTQVWLWRGMQQLGQYLNATYSPASSYGALGGMLLEEAAAYHADITRAMNASVVRDAASGAITFVPPVVAPAAQQQPYAAMTESYFSSYTNFRYYAEQLAAGALLPDVAEALATFRESHLGTISGTTRWTDHLDDMPAVWYVLYNLANDRMPQFHTLLYGHMANYQGRGTFSATEQLSYWGEGLFRAILSNATERDMDFCGPSALIATLATRWQLVFETWDDDTVYVAKGAPRRWYVPGAGGFSATAAPTRFGYVSFQMESAQVNASTQLVTAEVAFEPTRLPGVRTNPDFAVRLRPSDEGYRLARVVVGGGAVLSHIDAAAETVVVHTLSPWQFTITTWYERASDKK